MHDDDHQTRGNRRKELGASIYRAARDRAVHYAEHYVERRMFSHKTFVADPDKQNGEQKNYERPKRGSADIEFVCFKGQAQQPIDPLPYFTHILSKPQISA